MRGYAVSRGTVTNRSLDIINSHVAMTNRKRPSISDYVYTAHIAQQTHTVVCLSQARFIDSGADSETRDVTRSDLPRLNCSDYCRELRGCI